MMCELESKCGGAGASDPVIELGRGWGCDIECDIEVGSAGKGESAVGGSALGSAFTPVIAPGAASGPKVPAL